MGLSVKIVEDILSEGSLNESRLGATRIMGSPHYPCHPEHEYEEKTCEKAMADITCKCEILASQSRPIGHKGKYEVDEGTDTEEHGGRQCRVNATLGKKTG